MKSVLAVVLVSVVVVQAARLRRADAKYTSQYDNVDLQEILNNERLFKSYQDCLLEKGPCTPDAKELRANLPDALKTECSKCTEKQKQDMEIVIIHLINKKHEVWEELKKLYDPTGEYEKANSHYLKKAEEAAATAGN